MKRLLILIASFALTTAPAYADIVRSSTYYGPTGTYTERTYIGTPVYTRYGNTEVLSTGQYYDRRYIIGEGHYPPCRAFLSDGIHMGEIVYDYCHIMHRGYPISTDHFQYLNHHGYWQWTSVHHQYTHPEMDFRYKRYHHGSGFSVTISGE